MPNKDETIASAVAMIRTIDACNAAIAMAESLKLNAEVKVMVGKWDERGAIIGWTKTANTGRGNEVFVEVFISDRDGADRESARAISAIESLRAELKGAREAAIEECAAWHDQRRRDTPDAFEMEFHEVSAKTLRALKSAPPVKEG